MGGIPKLRTFMEHNEMAELEAIAHPGLRATAVTSPLCKSLTSTMLCGFLLLMSRAGSIAKSFRSR